MAIDQRWFEVAEQYAFDAAGFAVEVCGLSVSPTRFGKGCVSWQQLDILDGISEPGARLTVSSGHGTGKTACLGVIALWHLVCYYHSNTILTAPKIEQLRKQTWMEIADTLNAMANGPYSFIAEEIVLMDENVFVKGHKKNWWVTARTAPKGAPENLAGAHRDWLLILADEASGIPDANFGVLNGALSDARNRMALFSQPTRSAGYFYDTHHSKSVSKGGIWKALTLNAEESPLVSPESIANWRVEYDYQLDENGVCSSPQYSIKVLGLFPDKTDGFLNGRSEIEACFGRQVVNPKTDAYGLVLSVDVGAGEYRDSSVATLAYVTGFGDFGPDARRVQIVRVPIHSRSTNLQDFTGKVFRTAAELENVTVPVDAGGMGISVVQSLESLGLPNVVRVKWGNTPFKKVNKDRYFNLRAQAMVEASKAVKQGRLGFAADLPNKTKILDQGSRIPYHFDEKARYVIAKKEDMRDEGIPSPDDWDTICFCFLENVHYTLTERRHDESGASKAERMLKKTRDLFADA